RASSPASRRARRNQSRWWRRRPRRLRNFLSRRRRALLFRLRSQGGHRPSYYAGDTKPVGQTFLSVSCGCSHPHDLAEDFRRRVRRRKTDKNVCPTISGWTQYYSERPMRICIVSQEYPPETGGGGIGTQSYLKAQGLSARGH